MNILEFKRKTLGYWYRIEGGGEAGAEGSGGSDGAGGSGGSDGAGGSGGAGGSDGYGGESGGGANAPGTGGNVGASSDASLGSGISASDKASEPGTDPNALGEFTGDEGSLSSGLVSSQKSTSALGVLGNLAMAIGGKALAGTPIGAAIVGYQAADKALGALSGGSLSIGGLASGLASAFSGSSSTGGTTGTPSNLGSEIAAGRGEVASGIQSGGTGAGASTGADFGLQGGGSGGFDGGGDRPVIGQSPMSSGVRPAARPLAKTDPFFQSPAYKAYVASQEGKMQTADAQMDPRFGSGSSSFNAGLNKVYDDYVAANPGLASSLVDDGTGGAPGVVDSVLNGLGGISNTDLLSALGTLYSGTNVGDAIKEATRQITEGTTAAQGTVKSYLDPYSEAGKAALARYSAGVAPGGEFDTKFTMADAQNSDAEKWAQQQGMDTIQNSAAARGGLLGSNTLAGLNKFGQANAAQYQQQAFDQWLRNRTANQQGVQNLMSTGYNSGASAADMVSQLQQTGSMAGAAGTMAGAANQQKMIENILSAIKASGGGGGSSSPGVAKSVADWLKSIGIGSGSSSGGSSSGGSVGGSGSVGGIGSAGGAVGAPGTEAGRTGRLPGTDMGGNATGGGATEGNRTGRLPGTDMTGPGVTEDTRTGRLPGTDMGIPETEETRTGRLPGTDMPMPMPYPDPITEETRTGRLPGADMGDMGDGPPDIPWGEYSNQAPPNPFSMGDADPVMTPTPVGGSFPEFSFEEWL